MHLGVIPDGHRRYAENHNITEKQSYLKSQDRITETLNFLEELETNSNLTETIDTITIYALSEANLNRDDHELKIFYDALKTYLKTLLNETDHDKKPACSKLQQLNYTETEININMITTNWGAPPPDLRDLANKVEQRYNGTHRTINILLSYNGRKEIAQATHDLNTDTPTLDDIQNNLQITTDIDYVIRTGNNPRRECLSGFPLWQSSYAEYYHLDKNFPAVQPNDFETALNHYTKLRRNHGT